MFILLEEMSGMPTVDSSTASSMCDFTRKERRLGNSRNKRPSCLRRFADFERDCLLWLPTTGAQVQHSVRSSEQVVENTPRRTSLTSFWKPPSSSHNLMPSAAAVLGRRMVRSRKRPALSNRTFQNQQPTACSHGHLELKAAQAVAQEERAMAHNVMDAAALFVHRLQSPALSGSVLHVATYCLSQIGQKIPSNVPRHRVQVVRTESSS